MNAQQAAARSGPGLRSSQRQALACPPPDFEGLRLKTQVLRGLSGPDTSILAWGLLPESKIFKRRIWRASRSSQLYNRAENRQAAKNDIQRLLT